MPYFPPSGGGSSVWVNPLGPPLSTVVRYVSPTGSDSNDGKSWNTAKQTILAAYDDIPSGNSQGLIYIESGSYVGGEVANQGIWLTVFDTIVPGSGWRLSKPCTFQGIGGGQAQFSPNGAFVNSGQPGSLPSWDLTKPLIWVSGSGVNLFFYNIQPNSYGFCRIGVDSSGSRSSIVSNARFVGCTMASKVVSAANILQTGPGWDIGWANYCWWTDCAAYGGLDGTTPFSDPAWQSDQACGWLVRPNDPVPPNPEPGSTGRIFISSPSLVGCGIKYYRGAEGFGLLINHLIQENTSPIPVVLTDIPGSVPGEEGSILSVNTAASADQGLNNTIVSIGDTVRCQVGQIILSDIEGVVSSPVAAPVIFNGSNTAYIRPTTSTPRRQSHFGTWFGGRMSGTTDAGRRLGAPVAIPYQNLATHNPGAWTVGLGTPTITTGKTDVFGGTNAADIVGTFGTDEVYTGTSTLTLNTGDLVLAGVWVRGPTGVGADTPCGKVIMSAGSFSESFPGDQLETPWTGDGEWIFSGMVGIYQPPSGSSASVQIELALNPSTLGFARFAFPVLCVIPGTGASAVPSTEAWELLSYMSSWNPNAPVGSVSTLRGQKLIGDGGLGSNKLYTVGAGSGQITVGAAASKAMEVFDGQGNSLGVLVPNSFTVNP